MIVKCTPHISITDTEDLAPTVLMPGDPLRAKFIAEHFLTDYRLVNKVRNCFAYTGYYKGKKITIFASGMGQPSIGIYSYELFNFYGVKNIIRIGSAGAYRGDLKVYDTVIVKNAVSESTFAKVAYGYDGNSLTGSEELNNKLKQIALRLGITLKETNAHSSDVFYHDNPDFNWEEFSKENDLGCVEMEAFALFANAKHAKKNAACLLTISDSFVDDVQTTSEERQKKLLDMARISLELALYD